jgi:hypothetical protein
LLAGRGWGPGGEMNQALYAHMNNKRKMEKKKKKKFACCVRSPGPDCIPEILSSLQAFYTTVC